jgi:tetratricopeptide (TPR) repeat protein
VRERTLIWIAALLAFGGTLAGAFVFDDFALFTRPEITEPSGWWECWGLLQTRPLTWFTFWISDRFGQNPIGWHLVSLVLHLAVAALVWDVLRKLIPPRAALIAAVIFAVHPIVTESVAYVFARGTLLGACFSLLAIRSWIAERRWTSVLWFVAAMLAKEEYAALPLFLLLLDFSRRARIRWRPVAAMLAISLALGLRVVWATFVTPGVPAGPHAGISPGSYLLAQGPTILGYLRRLLMPWGFSVDYEAAPPPLWLALAAWTGIAALAVAACYRFRSLRAGFWFLAGLVLLAPSSSIFPAADLAADRRMYLPLAAFAACAGLMLQRVDSRVISAMVVCLIAISIRYTSLWISPEKLWSEAVRVAPGKLRPRLQLARSVPPDQALDVLADAAELAPNDPAVPAAQGRVLLSLRRPGEALRAFGRALALAPSDPAAFNNRGAALLALGQTQAARADFERALARDPCLFNARFNLAQMGQQTPDQSGCRYTPSQIKMLHR